MDKEKEKKAIERLRAFDRMLIARKNKGLPKKWENGEDVMRWWLGEPPKEQMRIEDLQIMSG